MRGRQPGRSPARSSSGVVPAVERSLELGLRQAGVPQATLFVIRLQRPALSWPKRIVPRGRLDLRSAEVERLIQGGTQVAVTRSEDDQIRRRAGRLPYERKSAQDVDALLPRTTYRDRFRAYCSPPREKKMPRQSRRTAGSYDATLRPRGLRVQVCSYGSAATRHTPVTYFGEKLQRLPAHLVDRVVTGPVHDRDVRHGQSQLVHVLDPGLPAPVLRHGASVGCAGPASWPLAVDLADGRS